MLDFRLKTPISTIFGGKFPFNRTQKQSDCSVMIRFDKWAASTYRIAHYSWVIVNQADTNFTNYHKLSMKKSEARSLSVVEAI